jgi:lysozyme family protein
MAVSYKIALPSVKKWEGGLAYFKNEGQWTNRGVQYSTYLAIGPLLKLSAPLNETNFKKMPLSDWEKFVEWYWNKATYNNSIKNGDSALMMFQAYWGSGGLGIKAMQRALNNNFKSNLAVDGGVGPATVGVINKFGTKVPLVLWAAIENFYKSLAATNPADYGGSLKGWLNRLADIKPKQILDITFVVLIATTIALEIYSKNAKL